MLKGKEISAIKIIKFYMDSVYRNNSLQNTMIRRNQLNAKKNPKLLITEKQENLVANFYKNKKILLSSAF